MKPLWKSGLVSALALLVACQTRPATSSETAVVPDAMPALLTNPGELVQQELAGALVAMSGLASVSLSGSELTQSSELVLERKPLRTLSGGLLQGRELERPQRFQLLVEQDQCWLLHVASGKRQRLYQAQCKAQSGTP